MEKWLFGVIIGLVASIILILILHFTAFKNKNMVALYLVILVICSVGGGILQYSLVKITDEKSTPTPADQMETVTDTVEDNWKNSNGGFTFEQIQEVQKDEEAPIYNDQVISLTCHDFGIYIVFSYKDDDIYQNILFYKSKNGLILDGMTNMEGHYTNTVFKKLWFAVDLNSWKWLDGRNEEPIYRNRKLDGISHDNFISLSSGELSFDYSQYALRTYVKEAKAQVHKFAAELTGRNATSHFIKFGDIELIGQAKEGYKKINSFYNYLYEQVKGVGYNKSKIVDGTSCLCVPIPTELQKNYPIDSSKKSEYGNADYYGVYKCNIAVDLTFKKGNVDKSPNVKNEDYVIDIENDSSQKDNVVVEDVKPNYTFAEVKLNFVKTQASDFSGVNLSKTPVKMTITCNELSTTKSVVIDSFDMLNKPFLILLDRNQTYNYLIDSEALIFENFRGQFVVQSEKTSIDFGYYYLDNFVIVSVGLNPVGSIDESKIDLSVNPVKIILSNEKQTYQFVFDNNSQLRIQKSMLMELGKYSYTILSKQLVFVSVTGNLTITTHDKVMLFNYSLKVDQPLIFDIVVKNYNQVGKIHLFSDSANVLLIRNSLDNNKEYMVNCFIYDDDGRLVEQFLHEHNYTGDCSALWTPQYMISGTKYTVQLRFTSKEDSSITYLSAISQLIYDSSKGYEIEYTVTKNS